MYIAAIRAIEGATGVLLGVTATVWGSRNDWSASNLVIFALVAATVGFGVLALAGASKPTYVVDAWRGWERWQVWLRLVYAADANGVREPQAPELHNHLEQRRAERLRQLDESTASATRHEVKRSE
jgi:hypothetical protein